MAHLLSIMSATEDARTALDQLRGLADVEKALRGRELTEAGRDTLDAFSGELLEILTGAVRGIEREIEPWLETCSAARAS
jgi:hypothetical protein